MINRWIAVGSICFVFAEGNAFAVDSLYQGAKARAMGNAFVAVADDDEAIFYNPAGLCGIDKYVLTVANANVELSNDLLYGYPAILAAARKPSLILLNDLVGKNLDARGQGTATFVGPCFGVSAIYDAQAALHLQDRVVPTGRMGAETTYGTQFAFAMPIKFRNQGELRLGIAAKVLWRSGGFKSPTITDLMSLNIATFIPNLSNTGIGLGVDTGLQYIYSLTKDLTLQAGAVYADIGNTSFSSPSEPLASNLTLGGAARLQMKDVRFTLSYDYDHVLEYVDWRKKTHLGMEVKLPVVSLYAGLDQFNFTYGLGVDLFFFRIMYLSYAEELGPLVGQNSERRSMLSISFKLEI